MTEELVVGVIGGSGLYEIEGFEDIDHPVLRAVRELHTLLPVDEETALLYGRLARELRADGRLIGTNDLWIGATSLRWELPVLTANPAEFSRIEGLSVVSYR